MSLVSKISDLTTRIAGEIKAIRTLVNGNAADLTALTTTSKTNLVSALNELKSALSAIVPGAQISDSSTASTTTTWSINKIQAQITAGINGLTNGAPTALDTLQELAAALGNDSNFASTVALALGARVRADVNNQALTTTQQLNARTNIDVYGTADIGDPTTNFVTVFNNGLV